MAMETSDSIKVALHGGHALVCVDGRGTFKVSSSLKRFAATAIDQGVTEFVVDMNRCEHLDSTFMGVLAGVALRLRKGGRGHVRLINLSAKISGLLETVGLDELLKSCDAAQIEVQLFDTRPAGECKDLEEAALNDRQTLETMLRAHEDLVSASPDNATQFTDVINYLRQAGEDHN